MRRFACLLLLLSMLVGCKSTVGPVAGRKRTGKPDPLLTSEEQQRWSRERFPYFEEDRRISPDTLSERYGPTGR